MDLKSILNNKLEVDDKFSTTLIDHYMNRDKLITSEEANLRIFGKNKDAIKHKDNRKEIHREIEGIIKRGKNIDSIKPVVLINNSGKGKGNFNGYEFNYDVYKKLCIKFNEDLYDYYIEIENIVIE